MPLLVAAASGFRKSPLGCGGEAQGGSEFAEPTRGGLGGKQRGWRRGELGKRVPTRLWAKAGLGFALGHQRG